MMTLNEYNELFLYFMRWNFYGSRLLRVYNVHYAGSNTQAAQFLIRATAWDCSPSVAQLHV